MTNRTTIPLKYDEEGRFISACSDEEEEYLWQQMMLEREKFLVAKWWKFWK